MKNLIHININTNKWITIINKKLSKDNNTCVGYKKNILKLHKKVKVKNYYFENELLFFHKKINLTNQNFYFILIFFKIIKLFLFIYYKFNNFEKYITTDDMSGPINLIFISFFLRDNKPIQLIPDTIDNNEKYFIEERSKKKKFDVTEDKEFISKYNFVCRKNKKKKIVISFFEKNMTIILDKLNILPKNPFKVGSIKTKRLSITPFNSHSFLKELIFNKDLKNQKIKFFKRNNLITKKPLIIVGMMNWHNHDITDKKVDQKRNHQMLSLIKKSFNNFNILISLHPKQVKNDYKWVENKMGLKIINVPMIDCIAFADMFVTSFGSSVIKWAEILKIKSLVFNFFNDKNHNIKNNKYTKVFTSEKNIYNQLNNYKKIINEKNFIIRTIS